MNVDTKTLNLLLITGEDAYPHLKQMDWASLHSKFIIQIVDLAIPIIAFATKAEIRALLKIINLAGIDCIILPGLIPWSCEDLSREFACKFVKGPNYYSEIIPILASLSLEDMKYLDLRLPTLEYQGDSEYEKLVASKRSNVFQETPHEVFTLPPPFADRIFSPHLPPLIMAEIVDFPLLTDREIFERIDRFQNQGADIIDLGCLAATLSVSRIVNLLPRLTQKFNLPFSIDSANPKEIHAAVQAGAKMVLNVTMDNFRDLLTLPKDLPIVLTPFQQNQLNPPEFETFLFDSGNLQVNRLLFLFQTFYSAGFTKLLFDPILTPAISPGILPTLNRIMILQQSLMEFRRQFKKSLDPPLHAEIPLQPFLFIGIGNITELMDGDSAGINTLLAALAQELHAVCLLTTEASPKSYNSVYELFKSRKLMYLAHEKGHPPINLGVSAFQVKSKTYPIMIPEKHFELTKEIELARSSTKIELDPIGYFKIYVDLFQNHIFLEHYQITEQETHSLSCIIQGSTAEAIYKTAIQKGLVSQLEHAAYLGKELQKAEFSLQFGMPYHQD